MKGHSDVHHCKAMARLPDFRWWMPGIVRTLQTVCVDGTSRITARLRDIGGRGLSPRAVLEMETDIRAPAMHALLNCLRRKKPGRPSSALRASCRCP